MTAGQIAADDRLMSRAVLLRPLQSADQDWCYSLMCGPAGSTWKYRGRTPSPDVVAADLWRGVFAQFVVVDRNSGAGVGLVGFYNVSTEAARAHAFAIADPPRAALVTEGFGLLCRWGFAQFGFSRVFLEVPEFNTGFLASLGDAAVVEGRLRNYELWQGRFWDLFIVSLTPDSFDGRVGDLLAARTGTVAASSLDRAALVELVGELWPLDSLGCVEVLSAAEDYCGVAVPDTVLAELHHLTEPVEFAEQLVLRIESLPSG